MDLFLPLKEKEGKLEEHNKFGNHIYTITTEWRLPPVTNLEIPLE